jgi:hypothetical protein
MGELYLHSLKRLHDVVLNLAEGYIYFTLGVVFILGSSSKSSMIILGVEIAECCFPRRSDAFLMPRSECICYVSGGLGRVSLCPNG